MRVLMADGDTQFLELERRFLSHSGHDVWIASDGLQCFRILREIIPDVVVMDCGLLWGGSDGVLTLMLDDPRLSHTQVILAADCDPRANYDDIVEWMLISWLRKPYCLNELLAEITNHLPSCELPNRRRRVTNQETCKGVES